MIVVVIVPSGFRDRMRCRSLHLVIAHPMCLPALDSAIIIPHVGFCGRWPIALSSSSVELGNRGIGAGSQFSRSSCSYSCSVFRAVDRGIVETTIPGGKRKRGEGSGYSPIQREDGKGEGGYRRDDDTWGEEKERRRIGILTHTEGGWEGRRRVSSGQRYRRHGLLG